ncbi:hypothetical protein C8J56DRAFT_935348 [Mycena floridula]|nr:hypothetical protein C8J56DRAFT_935348 [Mycena floridula]
MTTTSTRNPFRDPQFLSPQPTGISTQSTGLSSQATGISSSNGGIASSSGGLSPNSAGIASSTGGTSIQTTGLSSQNTGLSASDVYSPPGHPVSTQNTGTSFSPPHGPPPGRLRSPSPPLSDLPPPAYTPAPSFQTGETTVAAGPSRPFRQDATFNTSLPQNQSYPGPSQNYGPNHGGHGYAGPSPSYPAPNQSHHAPSPSSDFARDFYAAGEEFVLPPDRPSGQQYAPPPGQPPAPKQPESDGKPTAKPVPGHPLMNAGRVLVYPEGFECPKCRNIGYKQSDPSNPCRKCWNKYSKKYEGALTYAFVGLSTSQRPLPILRPPQNSGYPGQNSMNRPRSNLPPPQNQYGPPDMSYGLPSQNFGPPQQIQQLSPWARPPQGSLVLQPGDPRIGGRQCWRCDGLGSISVFIFETERCSVCNGLGRVF